MDDKKGLIPLIIAGFCFLIGYLLLLYLLQLFGVIVFVNRFSLFQEYLGYLGSSAVFFAMDSIFFGICCLVLFKNLYLQQVRDARYVRFVNALADISISMFVGIGVIYTAWGMMQAFRGALGNLDQDMAIALGPWGILRRLLDGGLLMALFTTVVGASLGYAARFFKFLVFGLKLARMKDE